MSKEPSWDGDPYDMEGATSTPVDTTPQVTRNGNGHHATPVDTDTDWGAIPLPPEPPDDGEPNRVDTPRDIAADVFAFEVGQEVHRQRVREAARHQLRAGTRPPMPMPCLLSDMLAAPPQPVRYLIEGLFPAEARVMLAAQHKAGKTTLMGNLLRSLADGDRFLGVHPVTVPSGRIVVLDDEMGPAMFTAWLRDQGIRNTDRIAVVSLRGRVSSFDILDPAVRREWVDTLRAFDPAVLVLDCLRPVLDALGLNEHNEAGRLLVALDELIKECGATEAVVVHHMGHNGERSRGDSRLRDWPDVEWTIVRQDAEDLASTRYFRAYGRDVDAPERRLDYDPVARRYTAAEASRRDASMFAALADVLMFVQDADVAPPKSAVETGVTGHAQKAVREAMKHAVQEKLVRVGSGPHGAKPLQVTDAGSIYLDDLSSSARQARYDPVNEVVGSSSARSIADEQRGRTPSTSARQPDEVCERCRRPASRLIHGRCESCAYPAGGGPDDPTDGED